MRVDPETGVEYTGTSSLEMFKGVFMRKKISQVEARKLKKRVAELEAKFNRIKEGYAGTRIHGWTLSDTDYARVNTASLLNHIVYVSKTWSANEVKLMAVEL